MKVSVVITNAQGAGAHPPLGQTVHMGGDRIQSGFPLIFLDTPAPIPPLDPLEPRSREPSFA